MQQTVTSSPPHHLDQALFWLRWFFLLGVIALVFLPDQKALLDQEPSFRTNLILVGGIIAAANIVLGGLSLARRLSAALLGILSLLFDSMAAGMFFWAYSGDVAPLLIFGSLAMLVAAYRFGGRGVLFGGLTVTAFGMLAMFQLDDPSPESLGLSLLLLVIFGLLGVILKMGGWHKQGSLVDPREIEARRLRTIRERARAIYEMANTLSATLDYRRVLEAAQDMGTLGLGEIGTEGRLTSAVLLFQGEDNKLRVVTQRRLTRADEQVAVPGSRGVLGIALKQAEPVFGGDARRDPELRYFVAFQEAKSVLAIPLRAGLDNYGVIVFGSDVPNAFSDEHVELLSAIGTQATIALQNAVLYQNILSEKERIVEVEEDARKKLSRDLHDGPTQSVAAIAMRVNYIRRLIERQPQQAGEELWKVEELARRTTKEIRHMLFTLRPLVLETQGLVAALEQLAEKMKETHNTNVVVQTQPNVEGYTDTNTQGVLFYIIEEAANNARKHAQSQHIYVRLYRRETFVVVEIEDDGVGFDVAAVDAGYDKRGSLGMVNMRERAELIEGTLRIQSAPGRGTKITILIPIHATGAITADGEIAQMEPLHLQSQKPGIPPRPNSSSR